MKIYLDIFFLVNMGMNFFVLALLSFFQNQPVRGKRLAAASALGALAAVLWVVLGIPGGPLSLLSGLLGNALWVRLAFGKSAPSAWIRNTAMFYLASFFLSGALRYLQGTMGIQGKWAFLMPASGAVTYGAFRFFSAWRGQLDRQREYILCTLRYGGRSLKGRGLLDTGNHLAEPFGRQPVTIGSRDFLENLWRGEEPLYRYIPYHTVGTERGMMPAFQAESLELDTKEGRRQLKNPWIAVSEGAVSSEGEYQLILNPDLLRTSID